MGRKASILESPRCLFALTLAATLILSAFVAFSLIGSSPMVNVQRGAPGQVVVLNPRTGAIIGFAPEGNCVKINACWQVTPGRKATSPDQLVPPHGMIIGRY
jgi:hypothetical protein